MKCTLCEHEYDNEESKPYSINPCGHYCCMSCLNKITNELCPFCRGPIQTKNLNRGILDLINPDYVQQNMLNLLKRSLLEEVKNGENSLKSTSEAKLTEVREFFTSLRNQVQVDKSKKINKIENDDKIVIAQLDHMEQNASRKNTKEVDDYLSVRGEYLEKIEQSETSELALENSKKVKELIMTKSNLLKDNFLPPLSYSNNFNGADAIGSILQLENDGNLTNIG